MCLFAHDSWLPINRVHDQRSFHSVSLCLIQSETKDTRPKHKDPPKKNEDPSHKGKICDQNHKGLIRVWRNGPRVQGRLAGRRADQPARAIAAIGSRGTSRQRLRVAKSHELPKVVRYQRMQVTQRYEIPRVASIKGYEDQKVPMTKGCIVIQKRMYCDPRSAIMS
ncbi:Uncharacterized protein Rs2_48845 [Raphanus sativus]|nr:Uncharacterized protein Rs2_48845 [Raphanus sativus]